MKELESIVDLREMNLQEMKDVNGGQFPSAQYMSDETIQALGRMGRDFGCFVGGFVAGFFGY